MIKERERVAFLHTSVSTIIMFDALVSGNPRIKGIGILFSLSLDRKCGEVMSNPLKTMR
jgi:hypothetical protein